MLDPLCARIAREHVVIKRLYDGTWIVSIELKDGAFLSIHQGDHINDARNASEMIILMLARFAEAVREAVTQDTVDELKSRKLVLMDRASLTKPNAVIDGALEVCRSLREYNAELAKRPEGAPQAVGTLGKAEPPP